MNVQWRSGGSRNGLLLRSFPTKTIILIELNFDVPVIELPTLRRWTTIRFFELNIRRDHIDAVVWEFFIRCSNLAVQLMDFTCVLETFPVRWVPMITPKSSFGLKSAASRCMTLIASRTSAKFCVCFRELDHLWIDIACVDLQWFVHSAFSFASLIASNHAFFGMHFHSCETNSRLIPGAILRPIIAASIASVPEPVKTS